MTKPRHNQILKLCNRAVVNSIFLIFYLDLKKKVLILKLFFVGCSAHGVAKLQEYQLDARNLKLINKRSKRDKLLKQVRKYHFFKYFVFEF
jgi:hypothetical protein